MKSDFVTIPIWLYLGASVQCTKRKKPTNQNVWYLRSKNECKQNNDSDRNSLYTNNSTGIAQHLSETVNSMPRNRNEID